MSVLTRSKENDDIAKIYGSYLPVSNVSKMEIGDKLEILCEDGLNYHVEVKEITKPSITNKSDKKRSSEPETVSGHLHFLRWSPKYDYKGSFECLYLAPLGKYSTKEGITKSNTYSHLFKSKATTDDSDDENENNNDKDDNDDVTMNNTITTRTSTGSIKSNHHNHHHKTNSNAIGSKYPDDYLAKPRYTPTGSGHTSSSSRRTRYSDNTIGTTTTTDTDIEKQHNEKDRIIIPTNHDNDEIDNKDNIDNNNYKKIKKTDVYDPSSKPLPHRLLSMFAYNQDYSNSNNNNNNNNNNTNNSNKNNNNTDNNTNNNTNNSNINNAIEISNNDNNLNITITTTTTATTASNTNTSKNDTNNHTLKMDEIVEIDSRKNSEKTSVLSSSFSSTTHSNVESINQNTTNTNTNNSNTNTNNTNINSTSASATTNTNNTNNNNNNTTCTSIANSTNTNNTANTTNTKMNIENAEFHIDSKIGKLAILNNLQLEYSIKATNQSIKHFQNRIHTKNKLVVNTTSHNNASNSTTTPTTNNQNQQPLQVNDNNPMTNHDGFTDEQWIDLLTVRKHVDEAIQAAIAVFIK